MISSSSAKNFLLNKKWLIAGILLLFLINIFYQNKIFSFRFVDEEDNLVLGNFLLSGQKLYSDLFSHHQPLAYVISAGFQQITNPQNIYELIKSHREFMMAWSLLWCVLLIIRFKEKTVLPLIIFETTKFYLLGNLFLSESLAIYPVFYLTLFLFEKVKQVKSIECLLIGLLIGLSALLLAPVWPFLTAYLVFLIMLKKPGFKQLLFLLAGGLSITLLTLPFIDFYYYFHNTFYINFKYYIPQSAEEKMPWSAVKSFFSPLTIFLSNDFASLKLVLKIIGIFFIISIGNLIKNRNFRILIIVITLLTLANIRYYTPGLEYTAGFHTLIWYGLFTLISGYFFTQLVQTIDKNKKRVLVIFMLVGISLVTYFSKDLFRNSDIKVDYEKNYSKQYIFGEAIRVIKNPNDKLFVAPDEWLLYFQGDIQNFDRMVNLYGWMSLVWELNEPIVEKFKTNPPEFFYCDCNEVYVFSYSANYRQMARNGDKTSLWILNEKFNNLSDEQRNKLRSFNFQLE